MLVDTVRFAERFNMRSQSKPGKLDIKRRKPGILYISLSVDSHFKQAFMTSLSRFMLIQCH